MLLVIEIPLGELCGFIGPILKEMSYIGEDKSWTQKIIYFVSGLKSNTFLTDLVKHSPITILNKTHKNIQEVK